MNALGKHLLLELKDCDREVLNNLSFLRYILSSAARQAGATVVEESFHQFSPYGVSGVVVLAESHLFVHTWPECGYAAVDIFTCGDSVRPEEAAQILIREFKSQNHSILELRRGILTTE